MVLERQPGRRTEGSRACRFCIPGRRRLALFAGQDGVQAVPDSYWKGPGERGIHPSPPVFISCRRAREQPHRPSRLLPIIEDDRNNPTLQQLEDAFNIEKVTKEFFNKYRELYLQVKDALDGIVAKDARIKVDFDLKNVSTVDFAKKLLGQIVFLYFLQKKGWFGVKRGQEWGTGSKHFLRELFDRKHVDYKNYFNDILEPLFYEALRLERPGDYYSRFDCRIPFLNGGLFDPIHDYDWWGTDILLPNELFSNRIRTKEGDTGTGILDVFDRYNFTVKEDEPLEKEVAVDPEMLGKVFENLLEVKDRKSKGTYYTPREIVHYMCQESLINYLFTACNDSAKSYQKLGVPQTQVFGNEALKKGVTQELYIEDPTGAAISRKDLEELIKHGEEYVEHDRRVEEAGRETKTYSYRMPESVRNHAKLIDEKLSTILVCDPAVGSGAFPVGMMNEIVRARTALTNYLPDKSNRTPYDFKRHAIQNCLYGVDIDPGAVEIAKLRLWLSLIVDEEDIKKIKPLPNLDYKIVQGNSLLGVEKNLFNQELFNQLEELKPKFFEETNAKKKHALKEQIDELISKITSGRKDFDFEVYFSEVFHAKKGFDVVIGNPPYGAELSKDERLVLDRKFYDRKSQTKNSAIYFIYSTGDLIHRNSVNSFIVPKSLCYSKGWNNCAKFVLNGLQKLIDTGKAFEKVKLEQVIFVRVPRLHKQSFINGLFDGLAINEFGDVSIKIFDHFGVLLCGQTPSELSLINKVISRSCTSYGNYVQVERGLNWQALSVKHPGKTPIYRGAQLYPYYLADATDFINLSKFDRRDYSYQQKPKILNQLAIAHVQNPYPHFFLQAMLDTDNKLVFETISCTFVKDSSIPIKFLLAINNSKLFAWLLYKFIYSNAIRSTRYDEQYVGRVPCPKIDKANFKPFIDLVDQILTITGSEDYLSNPAAQAQVKEYERQIDKLVYELYGLTEEEIKVVEGRA